MVNFFTKGYIGKLCLRLFHKNKKVEISGVSNIKSSVKRVYTEDGLNYSRTGGTWNVIQIDDSEYNYTDEEIYSKLDRMYKHLKTAWDYKLYCSKYGVSFTCKTHRFGPIYGYYQYGYMFFTFGIERSHVRYDVNYSITNNVHQEFTKWLKETFEPIEREYHNDLNL